MVYATDLKSVPIGIRVRLPVVIQHIKFSIRDGRKTFITISLSELEEQLVRLLEPSAKRIVH